MRVLRHILKSKYIFKIILVISILYMIIYINMDKSVSKYSLDDTYFDGIVSGIKYDEDKTVITIKCEKEKLIIYYKDAIDIGYGDTILVYGKLNEYKDNTIFNLFNYKKYYRYRKIYYSVYANSINVTKKNTNVINDFKNAIIKEIKNIDKSGKYILAFMLQEKYMIDNDVLKVYQRNGISHLFSISGMHISLFSGVIYYLVKKISYNNYFNSILVVIFLLVYLIMLDYPVSAIRAIFSFSLNRINRLFRFNIKKLDIMFLILSIMLIINPYYVFYTSFIFSYVISFFISLFSKEIRSSKHKKLYLSYICFISSLPLVIYNYYSFNVVSILLNVIYVPLVSFIIFPFVILCLIFPILDNVLYMFIMLLEKSNLFINDYLGEVINISVLKPSIYFIIIYYIILILYKKYKKLIWGLIFSVILVKYSYLFDNRLSVVYFDVGQGDSTFITYKNESILIDTGSDSYSDILLYMKSVGRYVLDYLIISHGDSDHAGGVIDILNNIKVNNVIINKGNYSDLEKNIIRLCYKKRINIKNDVGYIDIINTRMYFLDTGLYNDENDNSNVIYFNYNGYKFLFMGDAGTKKEEDLLNKYNIGEIDFLKVGHHGSNTSSSKYFIDSINPKYSIISVGENNRYGHPKDSVLNILRNSKIYRTDIDGSIMFRIKNNKLQIETCIP